MGAAISTFGALDIQKYVGHVDMLQNFGCPRFILQSIEFLFTIKNKE